jgi:hypothetical protein
MGEGPPSVPVEADIPADLLAPTAVVLGRVTVRAGNWRLAAENGYDEGHPWYLHRYGAWWTVFYRLPAWMISPRGGVVEDGWLRRIPGQVGPGGTYPGLGTWPKPRFWQRRGMRASVAARLPGLVQVAMEGYSYYAWYEPIDADRHRYFQIMVAQATGLAALRFRLEYWLLRRWLFVQFNGQDAEMIRLMPMTGPERLYRPDASITAWRRLCEHARGAPPVASSAPDALAGERSAAVAVREGDR